MNAFFEIPAVAELFALGGPVVLVLAAMSVLGLAIVMLKCWQFASVRINNRRFIEPALEQWRANRTKAVLQALEGKRSPIAVALYSAISGLNNGREQSVVREESARVAAKQLAELRSYFRPLEVIGILAPLLGLLGTVMGMIEAFRELEAAGSQVNPAILSGGIWEALLTTAVGLIVAIPAVAALNWLERMVERLHQDMQDALTRVFTEQIGEQITAEPQESTLLQTAHAH